MSLEFARLLKNCTEDRFDEFRIELCLLEEREPHFKDFPFAIWIGDWLMMTLFPAPDLADEFLSLAKKQYEQVVDKIDFASNCFDGSILFEQLLPHEMVGDDERNH